VEIVVDLVVVWEAEGAALEVSARVPEGEPEARYRLSIASTSRARDTTRVILAVRVAYNYDLGAGQYVGLPL
jgi:hypothetical protein